MEAELAPRVLRTAISFFLSRMMVATAEIKFIPAI